MTCLPDRGSNRGGLIGGQILGRINLFHTPIISESTRALIAAEPHPMECLAQRVGAAGIFLIPSRDHPFPPPEEPS